MRSASLSLLALSLVYASAAPAFGEAQNGGAAVCVFSPGIRIPVIVVPQPDSGAFVMWADTRFNGIDLFAQRLDRHGKPLLAAGGVQVWSAPFGASLASAIPDGVGGAIFAWQDQRGSTGQDIYVQRINADASRAYGANGILICNAANDQSSPQVVAGTGGFYYVVWSDKRGGDPSSDDLYAQRMSLAGAPQWLVNGFLINTVPYRQYTGNYPSIASDGSGGLVLAWVPTAGGGPRAQRVSSAPALVWAAGSVPFADPSDNATPSVAADGTGGMWGATSRFDGSNWVPYAHHLTNTGTSTFAPAGIALLPGRANGFTLYPVHDTGTGCWIYGQVNAPGGGVEVRQQIDLTGTLLRGAGGQMIDQQNYGMFFADLGNGVGVASYSFNYAGGRVLRVQRFGYDGTSTYQGLGVLVGRNQSSYDQTAVAMATSGNLLMVSQTDDRYNTATHPQNYQLFGQAFDASGTPLWDDAENPTLTGVGDAPLDQGGFVRATWNPGAGDWSASCHPRPG